MPVSRITRPIAVQHFFTYVHGHPPGATTSYHATPGSAALGVLRHAKQYGQSYLHSRVFGAPKRGSLSVGVSSRKWLGSLAVGRTGVSVQKAMRKTVVRHANVTTAMHSLTGTIRVKAHTKRVAGKTVRIKATTRKKTR